MSDQDERGTDELALVAAFGVFPFFMGVAGWLFGPIFREPAMDRYALSDSFQVSAIGAGIGILIAFTISGTLMFVRNKWHHQQPPVGFEESPEA